MKPEITDKKKRKKNTIPHPFKKTGAAARAKELRRQQHEERVAAWRILSPKVQLAELDRRGVVAKRQRERINKLLTQ